MTTQATCFILNRSKGTAPERNRGRDNRLTARPASLPTQPAPLVLRPPKWIYYIAYLVTQTNVAAAVNQGRESFDSAKQWLFEQVCPFFANESATFVFGTKAWYLRKKGAT